MLVHGIHVDLVLQQKVETLHFVRLDGKVDQTLSVIVEDVRVEILLFKEVSHAVLEDPLVWIGEVRDVGQRGQRKLFSCWQNRCKLRIKCLKVLHAVGLQKCLQADFLKFLFFDAIEGGLNIATSFLLHLLLLHFLLDSHGVRALEWVLLWFPELLRLDVFAEAAEESVIVRSVQACWWEKHVARAAIIKFPDHSQSTNAIVSVIATWSVVLGNFNHLLLKLTFFMSVTFIWIDQLDLLARELSSCLICIVFFGKGNISWILFIWCVSE